MLFKNTASQKVFVFAFDTTNNTAKTGDAANITAYISKDYGAITALTDTSATELDSTNAKGYYSFDISQTETNADEILVTAKSSTANIAVIGAPAILFTRAPNSGALSIDSNGRVDIIKVAGTTQTAKDIGGAVPAAAAGASGGLLISGSNSGTTTLGALTVTGSMTISDGLLVSRSTSNASAITATGNGTGSGIVATSGSGATGDGIQATAASTNGNGLKATGSGTGAGELATGGATGNGVKYVGGGTSGAGVLVTTTSGDGISSKPTAGHALNLTANGTTKHGINATGGATTSHGAVFTGGGVGHGILATSGGGATGNGIQATAASTNGSGLSLTKTGSGSDLLATSTTLSLAKTTNITGFNDIAATAVVSGGAITTSGGAVSTVTTVTNQLTAAQIATGVWQDTTDGDFTVASSIGKSLYTTGNAPGAASGLALVGSNMGTVSSVTGNVGGNVVGSVGSVTAGVTVTTNNDKTGYALSSAGVQAIWDALTSALTTASSIGKLLVDNINATISSRLASVSYMAPLDAAGTRSAVGLASANLDTQLDALPTAAENATAVLAAGDIDGYTLEEAQKLQLAAMAGKVSGAATTTVTIRAADDSKARITATVDADGNRSALTLDAAG